MKQLHMIRLRVDPLSVMDIDDTKKLYRNVSDDEMYAMDWGYLLHVYLKELFGNAAPKVFSADTNKIHDGIPVLGYTSADAKVLKKDSGEFANPRIWASVDWKSFASKPIPDTFRQGQRMHFSLRTAPVIRQHRKVAEDGSVIDERVEIDPFLREVSRADPNTRLDRFSIYRQWFLEKMKRDQGVKILDVAVTEFQLRKFVRRTGAKMVKDRITKYPVRPSVTFKGSLEIADLERFYQLLECGVGRHKTFGFGMMLLQRPR